MKVIAKNSTKNITKAVVAAASRNHKCFGEIVDALEIEDKCKFRTALERALTAGTNLNKGKAQIVAEKTAATISKVQHKTQLTWLCKEARRFAAQSEPAASQETPYMLFPAGGHAT